MNRVHDQMGEDMKRTRLNPTPRVLRRGRTVGLVLLLLMTVGACLAPNAMAAAPKTHYWVNACNSIPRSTLDLRAGHTLREHVKWRSNRINHGFSECMFVSKQGEFVLLYLTTSWMLTHYAGHAVTAAQEFSKIDAVGGFPAFLQSINTRHTQFLNSNTWDIGLRGDTLGLDTFGFFHRVGGRVPKFPWAKPRLYKFLNTFVMPHF